MPRIISGYCLMYLVGEKQLRKLDYFFISLTWYFHLMALKRIKIRTFIDNGMDNTKFGKT